MHIGYGRYKTSQVLTASPADLVVLTYDVALRGLRQAVTAMDGGDINSAHSGLVKAQRALEELQLALDRNVGDVAEQLHGLYGFFIDELVVANVQKDAVRVVKVLDLVEDLAQTWRTVAAQVVPGVVAQSA